MLHKKLKGLFWVFFVLLLVACGKRDDLTAADFPSIGSGLTASELKDAVGAPHVSSKNDIEIAQMMLQTLSVSTEVDASWSIENTPEEYYLYKLADGESAMVAYLADGKVVIMTDQPVGYEE